MLFYITICFLDDLSVQVFSEHFRVTFTASTDYCRQPRFSPFSTASCTNLPMSLMLEFSLHVFSVELSLFLLLRELVVILLLITSSFLRINNRSFLKS